MSISISTRKVLEAFQPAALESNDARLQDELGRFRIWAGNVSAHRPKTSRRSLEYRLRDASTLQERVLSLLQDLQTALASVGNSERQSAASSMRSQVVESEPHGSTVEDDDEDTDDFFVVEDEEPPTAAELQDQEVAEVHEIVNCLMRFSIALRNPARHDQVREASSTKWFEPYDIQHVKAKFPQAPEYLVQRLGKAISRHRQYFKYRREHHEKLTEGLDPVHETEERPSTIATSLRLPPAKGPTPNLSSLDNDDAESVATATSYAGTESGGDAHLRPPEWPEAGQQRKPFECPICYGIVEADTERSWQQHVYEDMPPYICVQEGCTTGDKTYGRRKAWVHHTTSVHHRHWICPYGCEQSLDSLTKFESHLRQKHEQSFGAAALQNLADTCGRRNDEPATHQCVLCNKEYSNSKRLYKHLGHHLEQLTLFALPKDLIGEDSEEDASDDSGDVPNRGIIESPALKADIKFSPPGRTIVRALYDFEGEDEGELSFHENDLIEVGVRQPSGWWDGMIDGKRGWFPSNYCVELPQAPEAHDELEVLLGSTQYGLRGDDDVQPDEVDGVGRVGTSPKSARSSLTAQHLQMRQLPTIHGEVTPPGEPHRTALGNETLSNDYWPNTTSQESNEHPAVPPAVYDTPAKTGTNTGTYICTFHGCFLRFDSHATLQRHKHKVHHPQPPQHLEALNDDLSTPEHRTDHSVDELVHPPIRFKDAVGRKFSFPWRFSNTWSGMQMLINQAFSNVEVIGEQVHLGNYDLVGPGGEMILPEAWDDIVQPGWKISMHMWPLPQPTSASGDGVTVQEPSNIRHEDIPEVPEDRTPVDVRKEPIHLTDALGRGMLFPWRICKSWQGMKRLIDRAFTQIDVIGEHVQAGHYDLTDSDGAIILPQAWESTIKPGWEITMHMWPLPEVELESASPQQLVRITGGTTDRPGSGEEADGDKGGKSVIPRARKKTIVYGMDEGIDTPASGASEAETSYYAKIHKRDIAVETLDYYGLSHDNWEIDPEYFVIHREIDEMEASVLLEHTKRLRAGKSSKAQKEGQDSASISQSSNTKLPDYPRIHKQSLDVETLEAYGIPYEIDRMSREWREFLDATKNRKQSWHEKHVEQSQTSNKKDLEQNQHLNQAAISESHSRPRSETPRIPERLANDAGLLDVGDMTTVTEATSRAAEKLGVKVELSDNGKVDGNADDVKDADEGGDQALALPQELGNLSNEEDAGNVDERARPTLLQQGLAPIDEELEAYRRRA